MIKIATDKIKKIIFAVITLAFFIFPFTQLSAEDYPAGFLGSGYREYLSDKKQNGYYVEVFTKMDLNQKERVNKRNQIEEILAYAYQAAPESANGILATQYQHKYNADNLKVEIAKQHQQREQVASAQIEGGFNYIPHSDGKIDYFKDGLLTRVENERVVDEFGNISIKDTSNMQYNDKRLLTSYDATLKDKMGNVTKLFWYGATYSADSVYYATATTNASKSLAEYTLKEIDPAGNVKLTQWKAVSYEGKYLRAFSQTIEDNVYGTASFKRSNITYAGNNPGQLSSYHEEGIGTDNLAYTLDRTDIAHNGEKDQLTGYHEVMMTTQIDGTKTKATTDAKFNYLGVAHQFGPDVEELDPDRILESIITITEENADGSVKTETATTKYDYEAASQLYKASTGSEFNGQEAKWYEYTDRAGHILSRNQDKDDKVTYSYVDADTLQTIAVSEGEVSAALKDGQKFSGTTETQFEILYGKPIAKQTHSVTGYYNPENNKIIRAEDSIITYNNGMVNNLLRTLDSQEYTKITNPLLDPENTHQQTRDIATTYSYDEKANLVDAQGTGTANGWEYSGEKGWYGKYTSTINIDNEVILGKVLRKTYDENKHYE